MIVIVLLVQYLSFVWLLWYLIFKKGAYPSQVSFLTKGIHAVVLYLVIAFSWTSACNLLMFLHHPGEVYLSLWLQPSTLGPPPYGLAVVITTACGILLLVVCQQMASRKRRFLKWYFVLWPVEVASWLYVVFGVVSRKNYDQRVFALIAIAICVPFAWSIAFYLLPSVKNVLFESLPEAPTPNTAEV